MKQFVLALTLLTLVPVSGAFAQTEEELRLQQQEIERQREAMEKARQDMERAREEMDRMREEMEQVREEMQREAEERQEEAEELRQRAREEAEQRQEEVEEMRREAREEETQRKEEASGIPEPPAAPAPSSIPEPPTIDEEMEMDGSVEISEDGDTTRIRVGKNELVIVEDEDGESSVEFNLLRSSESSEKSVSIFDFSRNKVFSGFEFGIAGFSYSNTFDTDVPQGMQPWEIDYGRSIQWAINPFELDVRLIHEHVKFSTGLGYLVRNFSFRNNYQIVKQNDSVTAVLSTEDLRKNRLRVGYITVPAMLHFNTHKKASKSFRVGGGVLGGMRLFQTYRTKYFADGQKIKTRYNNDWNTNLFILDLRAVVGYGPINAYATYSLFQMFEEDRGPELYPFTVGLNFTIPWD